MSIQPYGLGHEDTDFWFCCHAKRSVSDPVKVWDFVCCTYHTHTSQATIVTWLSCEWCLRSERLLSNHTLVWISAYIPTPHLSHSFTLEQSTAELSLHQYQKLATIPIKIFATSCQPASAQPRLSHLQFSHRFTCCKQSYNECWFCIFKYSFT